MLLWYVGWVTHQMSQSASAVSRALHIVDDRLQELERQVEVQRVPGAGVVEFPALHRPDAWWVDPAVDAVAKAPGRILHAACGDGWLVRRIVAAGGDAYGVDPRAQVVDAAELGTLDLRDENVDGAPASGGRGGPGRRRAERHRRRDGRGRAHPAAVARRRPARPGWDARRPLGEPRRLGGGRARRPRPTWRPDGRCGPTRGPRCSSTAATSRSPPGRAPAGEDYLVTAVRASVTSPYSSPER